MAELLSDEATTLLADLARALEGRYVIGDTIGSGRGGIVVRATHAVSGRLVALKVAWNDADARARVMREMVLTSEVTHPNVLPLRPIQTPDGSLVIEMPLAAGGTALHLLNARTPVPYARVLDIVRAVAGPLDQAHAAGIIHGALSPEKILFDESGRVFVTDFALHIPAVAGWDAPRPSAVADPVYSASEVRHDLPTTSARADQYGLAIIAYELLHGEPTWRMNEEGVLEIDALEISVSRPVAPGAPLSAGMAIKKATSRDPAHRYESVGAFARVFGGDSVEIAAAEHTHAEFTPIPHRRSAFWMLLPLVILIVGGLAAQQSARDLVISWFYSDWKLPGTGDNGRETKRNSSSAPVAGGTAAGGGSERRQESGAPNNTRVGDASSVPGSDRTVDPYTRDNSPVTPRNSSTRGARDTVPRNADRNPRAPSAAAGAQDSLAGLGSGAVSVTIDNGRRAIVLIDGIPRGMTPLIWQGRAGRHTVRLLGIGGYSPSAISVEIAGGDTATAAFSVPR